MCFALFPLLFLDDFFPFFFFTFAFFSLIYFQAFFCFTFSPLLVSFLPVFLVFFALFPILYFFNFLSSLCLILLVFSHAFPRKSVKICENPARNFLPSLLGGVLYSLRIEWKHFKLSLRISLRSDEVQFSDLPCILRILYPDVFSSILTVEPL